MSIESGGQLCILKQNENYKSERIYWNIYNFISQFLVSNKINAIYSRLKSL